MNEKNNFSNQTNIVMSFTEFDDELNFDEIFEESEQFDEDIFTEAVDELEEKIDEDLDKLHKEYIDHDLEHDKENKLQKEEIEETEEGDNDEREEYESESAREDEDYDFGKIFEFDHDADLDDNYDIFGKNYDEYNKHLLKDEEEEDNEAKDNRHKPIEDDRFYSESSKVKIPVEHKGVLEVPDDKEVDELPYSHFAKLVKKKGYKAVVRALTNLEVLNKNKNPKLSKWARNMIEKLHAEFAKEESANIEDIFESVFTETKHKEHEDHEIDEYDMHEHNSEEPAVDEEEIEMIVTAHPGDIDDESESEDESNEEVEFTELDIDDLLAKIEEELNNADADTDNEENTSNNEDNEDDIDLDKEHEDDENNELINKAKNQVKKNADNEEQEEDTEQDNTGASDDTEESGEEDEEEQQEEPEENDEEIKSISENYYIINTETETTFVFNPVDIFKFTIEMNNDTIIVKHPLLESIVYSKKLDDNNVVVFMQDPNRYIASDKDLSRISVDRFMLKDDRTIIAVIKDMNKGEEKFIKFDFNLGTAEMPKKESNEVLEGVVINENEALNIFAEYKIKHLSL